MAVKFKAPSRDEVTTINQDGSRYFVHPADVRGRFLWWRRAAGVLLILVYALLPIVQLNGAPAVFLDVINRRFHLFGITLATQDLWLFFFAITGMGFALFCVTAILGRVWCGWACPQTVFLEMFFRRIERWIDGDAPVRRALDKAPWGGGKVIKRVIKHGLYFLGAFVIAHIFLSYFVSLPGLYSMMHERPTANWPIFVFVTVLTGILYGNFAWFREQFCIVLCPYGRLQSALVDDDTINVGYDEVRGEPRGKLGTPGAGDCVDCRRCVQVCPTGIDIRHGLQLECIACTACIDACDEVMIKVGRPRGLIRYDSMRALTGHARRLFRPRLIIYALLMALGLTVFSFALTTRVDPVTVSALRMVGSPYYRDGDELRNNFLLRLINKQNAPRTYIVSVNDPGGHLHLSQVDGKSIRVELQPHEEIQRPLVVQMPYSAWKRNFDFNLIIADSDGKVIVTRKLPFLGPYQN